MAFNACLLKDRRSDQLPLLLLSFGATLITNENNKMGVPVFRFCPPGCGISFVSLHYNLLGVLPQ